MFKWLSKPSFVRDSTACFSSLSRLRNLTIHMEVFFKSGAIDSSFSCLKSSKPIEVFLDLSVDGSGLISADLSLGMLTELSIRFDLLDIYMYTGLPHLPITHTLMRFLLEVVQEGVIKLIEQGVLVLHPEETAPTMSRVYTSHVLLCRQYLNASDKRECRFENSISFWDDY